MSSLKVTGTRSVLIYCDCGAEHKLAVNSKGEYSLESTVGKKTKDTVEDPGKRRRTIFDAPLPIGGDDEEENKDEE
jgi:hypothetical protein